MKRASGHRRSMVRAAALGLSLVLVLASCRRSQSLPAPSDTTPVFLISIDTLRSDHLPAYGYKGVETPNLDSFRGDAVLYQRAYSHTPLTVPSHASVLTGLLPAAHGMRDNLGFQLSPKVTTVAEILKQHGYATGAAVSAFVLRQEAGLGRGFDLYDDSVDVIEGKERVLSNIQRDGASTASVATDWIARQQKPVFFFLHLYEPHTPYAPPEPYKSRYSSAYDGEIAYADAIVGTYLKALKEASLYDRALIIVMSDHGEGLGEHGEAEHGLFLYREAIQVPLMLKLPGQRFAGQTVAEPVQLTDIMPTILERTGLSAPAKLPGVSLTSFLSGAAAPRRTIYSESFYPRFHYGWADQHSLIDGQHHYIKSPRPELFDLVRDPAEKQNVWSIDRRASHAMQTAILPFIQEAEAPGSVDPEEVAKLAALGYLGSTVPTKPGEVLPDPKDHITTYREIGDAFVLFRDRKFEASLRLIERLLAENERILDLYELKAKVLKSLDRIDEAIAAGKEGLRLSPHSTHIAMDVANLLIETGQLDDAQKHAELALKTDPGQAHDILARIWIARKDLVQAEREAKLAVASDRDRVASLMTLARVEREQNRLDSALAHLDEALRLKKAGREVDGLYFLRGDVLARLGRVEEAERDLRREIQLFREQPLAYKNLVLLLVAEGRIPEATQLIRQLIEVAPTPPSYLAVCQVLETVGDLRGVRYWARQGLARYPGNAHLRRLAG